MNPKTLFIGRYVSAQCWYRCALPAIHLENADWIGVHMKTDPNNITKDYVGPLLGGSISDYPDFSEYEMIVVQQFSGEIFRNWIKSQQKRGIKVFYECDDWIHGIWNIKDHAYKDHYRKKERKKYELCMKQCDGMISSTKYLSEQYKKFNENQHVCLVSLDTYRYDIEFPERDNIVVGWSGGTGHEQAIKHWLQKITDVMVRNPNLYFMSAGADYASAIEQALRDNRCTMIPWTSIENYPYALTNFDISICPSHDSKYFKSKSDLRWLEASALGIPTISNPITYGDCEYTISVTSSEQFEEELEDCLYDLDKIKEMGQKAKQYVRKNRDISVGIKQWESVQKSFS